MKIVKTGLVITCYNSSFHLAEMVNNLDRLKQQFTSLLFVNDLGSSIEEVFFVEYCKKHSLEYYLNSSNLGPLRSRLNGMERLSHLDYVMFCDVDDEISEDVLFKKDFLYFDVISFGMEKIYQDGRVKKLSFEEGNHLAFDGYPTMLGRWFKTKTILPVLRNFSEAFGSLRMGEDLCFILVISTLQFNFYTVDRVGIHNYKREGSLSYRTVYDSKVLNTEIIKTMLWVIKSRHYAHCLYYFEMLIKRRKSIIRDHPFSVVKIYFLRFRLINFFKFCRLLFFITKHRLKHND